jgi:hypothetical protein
MGIKGWWYMVFVFVYGFVFLKVLCILSPPFPERRGLFAAGFLEVAFQLRK